MKLSDAVEAVRGKRYADTQRRRPGVVVSLPLADARAWDLRVSLP